MGRDKKKTEVPVSVYVEAKKRYLEQLQQILTPRLYEGFESLYDDALELLENEFEERKEQTKSILKTFQDALREIPIWNQDIIEHESDRIIQVSNCDYLDDLIDALFRAESKILTSVQTIKSSKPLKVKVPLASHFIHRCYICAAREIFKNPFVFNHFKELTPRDKQNNLREAIFMINEGITNAVRELLPIRDILKNSMKAGEYSGTESDNSSLSGTDSDYDSDESEETRKHKKHSKKHREEEEESESSSSSESDEESIEEPTSELKVQSLESEGGSSSIQTSSEEIKNLNACSLSDSQCNFVAEEESTEDDDEEDSSEDDEEDSSEDEELVQHVDEETENVNNIEMREELKEENEIVHIEKENNGFIGGLINTFMGSDNTIKLEDMGENVETQNSNEEEEPVEIKKIVFEGTKIPKEYRIQEESPVLEKIQEPIIQKFEEPIIKQVEEVVVEQQVSEPLIKEEVNHVPVEDNRSGGMILTLDELKRREKKMRKEKEQREREKEMLKFKKPYPITQQKNRDENMLSLIQRKRELYYKQINPEDQQSVISTGKMSISSSKGLTPDNRVKMIDNFLNQNKEEVKKQLSVNTQVEPKVISYMTPNIIKKVEEEDSGDEYQSDPELNA